MDKPWNFLIITVDERRYPPVYEDKSLAEFRQQYFKGMAALKENSLQLHRHYVASIACSPSRAAIYTGQHSTLHGVSQTVGSAKPYYDPLASNLEPNTVPTLGEYFRAGGYQTFYYGKWHLSYSDITVPGTYHHIYSTTPEGKELQHAVDLYKQANRLNEFGFDGWIGPDPHGLAPANMGINRDQFFVRQVVDRLDQLAQDKSGKPWLTVCSLTNPHDIVFFGLSQLGFGEDYPFPEEIDRLQISSPPTLHEDLTTKPKCQQDYAARYAEFFFPTPIVPAYYKMYYYLQMIADQHVQHVYQALKAHAELFENTIVVFTSDHGDMMGAHGGMHQKWYNAYEESIHVECIFSNPQLYQGEKHTHALTNHIDLVPTLIGLAGFDYSAVKEQLQASHTDVRKLVGTDLSELVKSGGESGHGNNAVFYMTNDNMTQGMNQINFLSSQPYQAVEQPNCVETIITRLKDQQSGQEHLWKYSCYGYNPKPKSSSDKATEPNIATEYELYNLTVDPMEQKNLATEMAASTDIPYERLASMMAEQKKQKLLYPLALKKDSEQERAAQLTPVSGDFRDRYTDTN